jgi:hypothetical protein
MERVRARERKPNALILSAENHLIGHRVKDAEVAQNCLAHVPSNRYHVPVNDKNVLILWDHFMRNERLTTR